MAKENVPMECPFCGFTSSEGEYAMLLHMETYHAEGDSPFLADKETSSGKSKTEDDNEYFECPVDGCGETILMEEMDFHIELHAEEAELDDRSQEVLDSSKVEETTPGPSHSRSPQRAVSTRQQNAIQAWKNLLVMPSSKRQEVDKGRGSVVKTPQGKRLGRSQLGKYAHEDSMPGWLVSLLEKEGQVDQAGVVPVLEQLLTQSSTTKHAYLCHSCVRHVSKLKKEGGFCGYRNIQMLTSFIMGARFQGHQHFKRRLPTVFQIQDIIEAAWDSGINAQGRIETGGIKGTRKYIGTPEALAMLRLLGVPCDAQGFKDKEAGKSEALLMEAVESYFISGVTDPGQKIRATNLPPVYFQHAGHSMTIVGFEKQKNGSKNLLVFDPMFSDASSIVRLSGKKFEHRFPDMALKPYRRGNKYLKQYREFEILRLRSPQDDQKP